MSHGSNDRLNEPLNIAVDCRALLFPNSGFGRYLSSLLSEFAAGDSPHRFHLYCERPFEPRFRLPAHWRIRTGKLRFRGSGTLTWQLFYPFWARRDRIDVFWSPRNHLPLFLPGRTRKIVTVHDVVWKRYPRQMDPRVLLFESLFVPLSLRMADCIITVSNFSRSEILSFFPGAKSKLEVVYLASSLPSGEVAPALLRRPYFLAVGCEPRKNLERMLHAYLDYRRCSREPWDLAMVATGDWGSFNIGAFIADHQLESCVHLLCGIDDAALAALYAHAGALAIVSLYEGFGLPAVEAMQWGLPLIASNSSSLAEIVGGAGLSIDPRDTSAIAAAFRSIEEDAGLRAELARKSRERGRDFSWRRAASETMALLTREGPPGRRGSDTD